MDKIKIYNYIAKTLGILGDTNHSELIDKYSQQGWKVITTIANDFDGRGKLKNII